MKTIENVMKITIYSLEELDAFVKTFCRLLSGKETIFLVGELGAGKTTFTKYVAKNFNVEDNVISPTFVLQKQYEGSIKIYHYDLYRLDELKQIRDIEFYDVIGMPGLKIVEWADKFPELSVYADYIINIFSLSENTREITIRKCEQKNV
ncbi:MAG: tRNA (adenosine(37)-N6)-threonylcarbamoyltransferase complex ATPase subunit type 1 TsaE [Caldisericia bacterium]|nr:tRNA (adenosine(37)-N6)-threonylcarbamoyltransferase complex ATPase subunit type 1 TsaE [Caldisericia bacterium]